MIDTNWIFEVFQNMRQNGVKMTQGEFSKIYLGQCASYLSATKAARRPICLEAQVHLAVTCEKLARIYASKHDPLRPELPAVYSRYFAALGERVWAAIRQQQNAPQ